MQTKEIESKLNSIERINHRLNTIIENLPGVFAVLNVSLSGDIEIVKINKQAEAFTGYTLKELESDKSQIIKNLILPSDRKFIRNLIYNYRQESHLDIQFRIETKKGKIKWCLAVGKIREETGQSLQIECMIFDITFKKVDIQNFLELEIKSADQERRRIAEELHDNLQQTLATSQILFESIIKDLRRIPSESRNNFIDGYNTLLESIQMTRDISHNLIPQSLEDFGLVVSIKSLIEKLNNSGKINATFFTNIDEFKLSPEIESNLFRVIQSSVKNVLKHAEATNLNIDLIIIKSVLSLVISDDGVGFDISELQSNKSGFGLQSMKNRMDLIGAYFDVSSSDTSGTQILIELNVCSA